MRRAKHKVGDLVRLCLSTKSEYFSIHDFSLPCTERTHAVKKLCKGEIGLILTVEHGNRDYYVVLIDGSYVQINDDYLEKVK